MSRGPILDIVELGFQWQGLDPFIFTMHHLDMYPEGNDEQGPVDALQGRNIGSEDWQIGPSDKHGASHAEEFLRYPHVIPRPLRRGASPELAEGRSQGAGGVAGQ